MPDAKPSYRLSCPGCGHLWWSENPLPACCPQCGNQQGLTAPDVKPKICCGDCGYDEAQMRWYVRGWWKDKTLVSYCPSCGAHLLPGGDWEPWIPASVLGCKPAIATRSTELKDQAIATRKMLIAYLKAELCASCPERRGEQPKWKPEQTWIDHLLSPEFRDVDCLKRTLKAYVESSGIVCDDWDRMLAKVIALETELKRRGETVGRAWALLTIADHKCIQVYDGEDLPDQTPPGTFLSLIQLVRPAEEPKEASDAP